MTSRVNLDNKEAFVLHYYNYRDNSLIVNFFISDYGKISAVARGVKNSRKNQFSLLQPFQKLNISLSGKSDLLTLKSVEQIQRCWQLSGKALYCAFYINELLLRLLPSHTDCHSIFELYQQILDLIIQNSDEHRVHYEVPLRIFELKLLEFLGYGLNISNEIHTGQSIDEHRIYYYLIHSGPSATIPEHNDYLIISGKTLIDLANNQFGRSDETLHECKQLLKWALSEQLGEKPLKSREMFKQLYGKTS